MVCRRPSTLLGRFVSLSLVLFVAVVVEDDFLVRFVLDPPCNVIPHSCTCTLHNSLQGHRSTMARRARLQLGDVLHQLSDDEWAADGSDDDLGMTEYR